MTSALSANVDYMINAPCNLHCPFCYGPSPDFLGELSKPDKIKLLKYLSDNVASIVIGGGEPLLSPDFNDIVTAAVNYGLKVAVQTNGFYIKRIEAVLPHIDWIGIPLDGISEKSQLAMRTNKTHFATSKTAIEFINNYKQANFCNQPKIKIGTVVSTYNIEELDEIATHLNVLNIDIWKLYKIRRRGKGENIKYSYLIDDNKVTEKLSQIKNQFPDLNIYYSTESSTDAYIIIDPNSSTYVIKKGIRHDFGCLLDINSDFNYKTWRKIISCVDLSMLKNNIYKSFPNWTTNLNPDENNL